VQYEDDPLSGAELLQHDEQGEPDSVVEGDPAGSASPDWGGATSSISLASRARSRLERGAAVRVASPVSRPCLT
jgi:hypothetical protein